MEADEDGAPQQASAAFDAIAPQSPRREAAPDTSERELASLRRRLDALERRPETGSSSAAMEPLDEDELDMVAPAPADREQELREGHEEFDRQAAAHHAEPVNAEWRARIEPSVIETAETRAQALGLEFRSVSCRSTSCLAEFTAPNEAMREQTQGRIAGTNFAEGCSRFVVAYPDPDPDATQTIRMVLDCSQP